jgi:hypothetical protein
LKFFIDENWVYFCKNAALYKSPVDSYGFFNTEHGIPVDLCPEAKDRSRVAQLERLKSLLMPKPELSDDVEQMVLF